MIYLGQDHVMIAKIIEVPTYRERTFVFRDRHHAGKLLAEKLREYVDKGKVLWLSQRLKRLKLASFLGDPTNAIINLAIILVSSLLGF